MRQVLRFVTSRYGIAGLVALAVVMVVLVGRLMGLGGHGSDSNTSPIVGAPASAGADESGPPDDGPVGTPSAVAPVVKPGQPGPLQVATTFSAAYLKSAQAAKSWRQSLTRYASTKLAAQIPTMDPATVPAQRRTGAVKLADHGAVWADVDVPTDQGTLVFRLVSTKSVWQVDGIDWNPRR